MEFLGTSLSEKVANALSLSSRTSVRNIGILMERERGITKPVFISSLPDDKKIFGDLDPSMYSPYVMEMLFNNLLGAPVNIWGLRIVGATSVAASGAVANAYEDQQTFVTTTEQLPTSQLPQINHVTVGDKFDIGDQFKVTKGVTTVSFTVVEGGATKDAIVAGVVAAIAAQKVSAPTGDFQYITPSAGDGFVILTETRNNQAFTQTSSTVNIATSTPIFTVKAGRQGIEDKGTWGNNLSVKVFPKGAVGGLVDNYLMQVFYSGAKVESWSAANFTDLAAIVNTNSEYVLMEETDYDVALTRGVQLVNLSGGTYVAPVAADFEPKYDAVTNEPQGMAIFEDYDVNIIVCPEIFSVSFAQKADAFCTSKRKHFVFNLPYLATEAVAQTYNDALVTNQTSFSSSCLDWAEIATSDGGTIWVPSIGYHLGAGFVRACDQLDGKAWAIPAGDNTVSKGIIRFSHAGLEMSKLSRYATEFRTNVIAKIPNIGNIIYSSRTYSSNPLFESIHVRLFTNWLGTTLLNNNVKFVQKLITSSYQKEVFTSHYILFKFLYDQGALEQSIPFEENVTIEVKTDKTNRKKVDVVCSYIPTECSEQVSITISRNDGVLTLKEGK